MSGAVAIREASLPPAEITHPAEAELEIRRHQAVLDIQRRARIELREQVVTLRKIVEYAVRGADLVDEMQAARELRPGPGQSPEVRGIPTLADVGLNDRRLAEWRSLRDHDALAFIDLALQENRQVMFEKASVNWLRKRVERVAREQQAADSPEPAYDYELRHGDFRTVLDDLAGTVDAIVTDPPYPAEFLDEYEALGEASTRLLRPGGLLVAMVGQANLPAYLERLGRHLEYRWCAAYLTAGAATRVGGRRVGTKWKPLLIYGGDRFIVQDVLDASLGGDKRYHDWGQSESGMAEIVDRFTRPGELVVDPFLGAGTTAVACHQLGRRFVGCDTDAAAVATARRRLDG